MILVIDAGNTNIVIGGCCEEGVAFHERIVTDKKLTAGVFERELRKTLQNHPEKLTGACICSVTPEINGALMEGCKAATGLSPLLVDTKIDTGLSYKLTDISDLGPDLIAGAAAACELYTLPAVVIDTGTATTVMAVDSERGLLGGAIVPGIRSSFNSLFSNASMLHEFDIDTPERAIGRNTAEAVASGAIFGYADMIDGLCRRFEAELGSKPAYIITGGLAYRFMDCCTTELIHDDMLVLKGVYCIYKRNCEKND